MSGVKGRSGRQAFHFEAKKRLKGMYPMACAIMEKAIGMKDGKIPKNVKDIKIPEDIAWPDLLAVAKYICDQSVGKAKETKEIAVSPLQYIHVEYKGLEDDPDLESIRLLPSGEASAPAIASEVIEAMASEVEDEDEGK